MLALASAIVTVSDVFYCVLLYFIVPLVLLRERSSTLPRKYLLVGTIRPVQPVVPVHVLARVPLSTRS